MNNLTDKIIFITGASSGIGKACAHAFAAHGAKLILCARRAERLQQLTTELQQKYQTMVHSFKLDVSDLEAVKQQLSNLPLAWQDVDVLVNNAGLSAGLDKIQEADINDWERMLDTNVKGLLYVTRMILPRMVERDQGHIINIGSVSGHEVYPGGSVYCASKHAERAISKGLLLDLCDTQVRVSSVDPGLVPTEFSEVRFHGDKQRAAKVYQGVIPLTAEDVADAVLYCATRPPHVNIAEMIIMPTDQASVMVVHRRD